MHGLQVVLTREREVEWIVNACSAAQVLPPIQVGSLLSCARQMSVLGAGHVKQDMLSFLASELMYSVSLIINELY